MGTGLLTQFLLRIKSLFRRRQLDRDLDDELIFHLAEREGKLIASGMPSAEAHFAARRMLGNPTRTKESARDLWRFTALETFYQDVRYALRGMRLSPWFAGIAILSLALGIGANTAIFSLIDAVMLRAFPVNDPANLVLLKWRAHQYPSTHGGSFDFDCPTIQAASANVTGCSLSKPFLEDVRSKTNVLSGLAAFSTAARLKLSGNGPASVVFAEYVSGDYFQTLGIGAAIGRTIQLSDDTATAAPVLVLDYSYWKNAFGGDPGVVGKTIHLNNLPFAIVGVTEPRFVSLIPGRVWNFWIPIAQRPHLDPYWKAGLDDEGSWWITAVGRLKPGVTRAQAESAISLLFFNDLVHGEKQLSKADDAPAISLLPAQTALTGARNDLSTPLNLLMSAVGVILLIACANVAGLLLARTTTRQKEIAVRLALGAGRGRIIRQLLAESVTLSLAGGTLGIVLAFWSARALLPFLTSTSASPGAFSTEMDLRVLAFAFGVSMFSGILFGLAPAMRSMRVDLTPALRKGAGKISSTGRGQFRFGDALVVAQVALSVVVLVGAGLLVHTLENLERVDPGFSTQNLLNFGVDLSLSSYKGTRLSAIYNDLRDRFAATPGVLSATYSDMSLLSGSLSTMSFHAAGTSSLTQTETDYFPVGPNFFETMGIGFVSGRIFTSNEFLNAAEAEASPEKSSQIPVPVIANEAFAHVLFPNMNPLEQRFGGDTEADVRKYSAENPNYRRNPGWIIVGVVRDVKDSDLRRGVKPTIFVPSGHAGSFELRTAGNPLGVVPAIREVVRQAGSDSPVFDITTESKQIEDSLFQDRLIAHLGSLFAILALLLSSIGLFGLLSYEVTRRTQEIGVRIALGAQRRDILRNVLGEGILLAAFGAVIGSSTSFALTRYLRTLLFEVKLSDPFALAFAATLLLVVAIVACYIPARRATHVDPIVALRYE